jgi:hypothetical protein
VADESLETNAAMAAPTPIASIATSAATTNDRCRQNGVGGTGFRVMSLS